MSSKEDEFSKIQIGDYILDKEIGSGGFGKVVEGIHIPTGEKVAIKILDKQKLNSDPLALKRIFLEISILKNIRHKNIIKLYEVMETAQKIYLIMEYCKGGELFNYIINKKHLTEKQSCKFFHEIIDALEYLHVQNIVHRDIKPQNILLDIFNNEITLKIIDFGISNIYSLDNLLESSCGTASYAPPEMHKGDKYFGLLTDIWSAGVVLYIMNFGYLPFCEEDENKNINNIINGIYDIPKDASAELKDFLKHLLDVNPLTRYDFEQIKKHPWYNIISSDSSRPGIIIGFNKIPIDENIINLCYDYGYDKNLVRQSVLNNNYDSNSSIYYILLQKLKHKGIKSISDLYSDKFMEFMNDPNNLLINSKEENKTENQDKKINNINETKLKKNNDLKAQKTFNDKKHYINNNKTLFIYNSDKNNIIKRNDKKGKNNNDKRKGKFENNFVKNNNPLNGKCKNKIFEDKSNLINNKKINYSLKINNNKNNSQINNLTIEKRIIPLHSYFIHSKTNIIFNNKNTFNNYETIKKLNNSFNEKLTDDIKENILKLLNPKNNKNKNQENILNLKYKIKNGVSLNKKSYNNSNNKQIKNNNLVLLKNDILKQEKYTIIKNRNASSENRRNKQNKNTKIFNGKINNKNKHNRKLSLSPINTKNILNINPTNVHKIKKINIFQNTICNSNLITRRNHRPSDINEDNDYFISDNGFNSNNSNNIKVSKIIKNQKMNKKNISKITKIRKINTIDNNSKRQYHKEKSFDLKLFENKSIKINNKINNNDYNYNYNLNESNEKNKKEYLTPRKAREIQNRLVKHSNFNFNSFYETDRYKKSIRITLKTIKEKNDSNIIIYNKNSNKCNNRYFMSLDFSKIKNDNRNHSLKSRKDLKENNIFHSNKKKNNNKKLSNNSIKKYINIKSNLMPKNKSMRNNSMILNKIKKEKKAQKSGLMNISSFKHRRNKSIIKSNIKREYKGPIDIKNLIVSNSIIKVSENICNILN